MTTEADRPTEPEEELLGSLLLTAVSLKLSGSFLCPHDTLVIATIVGHGFKRLPACLLSNSHTLQLY